jgi:hypothetical protein
MYQNTNQGRHWRLPAQQNTSRPARLGSPQEASSAKLCMLGTYHLCVQGRLRISPLGRKKAIVMTFSGLGKPLGRPPVAFTIGTSFTFHRDQAASTGDQQTSQGVINQGSSRMRALMHALVSVPILGRPGSVAAAKLSYLSHCLGAPTALRHHCILHWHRLLRMIFATCKTLRRQLLSKSCPPNTCLRLGKP